MRTWTARLSFVGKTKTSESGFPQFSGPGPSPSLLLAGTSLNKSPPPLRTFSWIPGGFIFVFFWDISSLVLLRSPNVCFPSGPSLPPLVPKILPFVVQLKFPLFFPVGG